MSARTREPVQGPPVPLTLAGGTTEADMSLPTHPFVEPTAPGKREVGRCSRCSQTRARHPEHVHSVTTCRHDSEGPSIWWLCGHAPQFTARAAPDELHYTRGIGSGATHRRVTP